jgi:Flp pilus assembly pilin Flp
MGITGCIQSTRIGKELRMKRNTVWNLRGRIAGLLYQFGAEERGGQFMEIALYIALVVIVAAGALTLLGPKVAAKFTEIMNKL